MPDLPVAPSDVATRQLCAAVLLDPGFADEVHARLVGDGLSTVAPPVGLHLPALLQLATHSRRIRAWRDWALIFCWALAVFCVLGPLLVTRGTRDFPPALFGVVLGVASVATLAWTVATTARWLRVHTATELVRTPRSPVLCAPPLSGAVHGEIVLDQGAEVVCYSGDAQSPFAAYGQPVDTLVVVSMPVVAVPRTEGASADAAPRETFPLDAADLHLFLRDQLRSYGGVLGVDTRSKLFIRGDAINSAAALWPQGKKSTRPARAAQSLIYSGINDPGDRAATYLSFEAVRHGGMLVVSMHVRLRTAHDRLSIEIASYVAAPLAAKYTKAGGLPRTSSGLRAHARWHAFLDVPVALVAAPVGPFVRFLRRRAATREKLGKLRDIRLGKNPDRGVETSVRALAMDMDAIRYQEEADARDILQRLRRGIYDKLLEYFEDHGIATAEVLRVRDNLTMVEMKFR